MVFKMKVMLRLVVPGIINVYRGTLFLVSLDYKDIGGFGDKCW
jgi:hypothetical protein